MQWIDVKERLPNIKEDGIYSDDVLIYEKDNGFYVGNYADGDYWIAKETCCARCGRDLNPTHWAKLPKGPNDDK